MSLARRTFTRLVEQFKTGQVVMGGDSCSEAVDSNSSTVYWMDIFYIDLL